MKLKITPEQLAASPELQAIGMQAVLLGTRVEWEGDSSVYILDSNGEKYISTEQIQVCLDAGVEINEATLYSPVVPRTTLDNKVPSDWVGALKEDGTTKTWEEYTHVFDYGSDTCCVLFRNNQDVNGNLLTQSTDKQVRAYIEKFGGFMSKQEFLAWQALVAPVTEEV